jgi:hypothetical protein
VSEGPTDAPQDHVNPGEGAPGDRNGSHEVNAGNIAQQTGVKVRGGLIVVEYNVRLIAPRPEESDESSDLRRIDVGQHQVDDPGGFGRVSTAGRGMRRWVWNRRPE